MKLILILHLMLKIFIRYHKPPLLLVEVHLSLSLNGIVTRSFLCFQMRIMLTTLLTHIWQLSCFLAFRWIMVVWSIFCHRCIGRTGMFLLLISSVWYVGPLASRRNKIKNWTLFVFPGLCQKIGSKVISTFIWLPWYNFDFLDIFYRHPPQFWSYYWGLSRISCIRIVSWLTMKLFYFCW